MSTQNSAILVLLLITTARQLTHHQTQYEISPSLPPTAFIGQYYTVNFRVSGLTNPLFTFQNLPSCFIGSSGGTIQGTPDTIGSYNIKVSYHEGADYGQQAVILRVSTPDYSIQISKVDGSYKKDINWVQLEIPCIYQVGDRISINLNQYAKSNDYTWSFIQLPQMLSADVSGKVIGSFYNEGYYSFGATCSNSQGNSIDYFFTFNIQPINYRGKYRAIYQVPNRNVFKYNLNQIEALRNQASLNVEKAQKLVNSASYQLGKAKGNAAKTESNLKMANAQVGIVQKAVALALKQKGKEFDRVTQLQIRRDKAEGNQALKKFAYNQAVKNTNSIQIILDAVTKLFNKLTDIFNSINQKFIDAQNQRSQAETDLSSAKKNYVNANQDVKASFSDLLSAKKLLQYANNNKSLIDLNASAAFDQRDIANFQNDAANSEYNSAEKKVGKALKDLQAANSTVVELQQAKSEAKNYLGQAQFNLLQANNRLFVAQAAKAQSDKAILIASTQSSQLPIQETTYIFSGCQIGNYPIISGTACVQKSSTFGYQLNSGYTLLYGDCTEGVTTVSVGENVNFRGYLRDGYIHGVKIYKN